MNAFKKAGKIFVIFAFLIGFIVLYGASIKALTGAFEVIGTPVWLAATLTLAVLAIPAGLLFTWLEPHARRWVAGPVIDTVEP
jgi:hypothetical protein